MLLNLADQVHNRRWRLQMLLQMQHVVVVEIARAIMADHPCSLCGGVYPLKSTLQTRCGHFTACFGLTTCQP
jgi:hypothetical protein